MPARRCAIPVLIIGRIPVSTTLRASIPAGVPAKLIDGNVKPPLRPMVMCRIAAVLAMASSGVPPTNFTIAGAAARLERDLAARGELRCAVEVARPTFEQHRAEDRAL